MGFGEGCFDLALDTLGFGSGFFFPMGFFSVVGFDAACLVGAEEALPLGCFAGGAAALGGFSVAAFFFLSEDEDEVVVVLEFLGDGCSTGSSSSLEVSAAASSCESFLRLRDLVVEVVDLEGGGCSGCGFLGGFLGFA
jgi:hypothetical protein